MIIGIAGPKRSGKNTLALGLCAALGLEEHSFAAPLRQFVADMLGWNLWELEHRKEEPIEWLDGVTPRHMMQTLGTEWGRMLIHPDLWLRALAKRLPAKGAVIADVRFENEARVIHELGGVVIQLSRPGFGSGDHHVSEIPIAKHLVTYQLINNSTPQAMVAAALHMLGRA